MRLTVFTSVGLASSTGFIRLASGFTEIARQHLARGVFSESDRREQIFDSRQAVFRRQFLQILAGDFLQARGKLRDSFSKQALPHFRGFFALLGIDEVPNFAFGVGRLDEAEPVATGLVPFLRKNLNHIAADDFVAQRNHLPVHFCAHALVANFRVHGIGKIHGRRAARAIPIRAPLA